MKHLSVFKVIIAFCMASTQTSCSLSELNLTGEAVKISLLQGEWDEYYDDPAFVMDGGLVWIIGKEEIVLHTYDFLSDSSEDWHIDYNVSRQRGQYIINLHYPNGFMASDESFHITVLNEKEMAWQKVGTTFSARSYSSDYKHFVNENYWKKQ